VWLLLTVVGRIDRLAVDEHACVPVDGELLEVAAEPEPVAPAGDAARDVAAVDGVLVVDRGSLDGRLFDGPETVNS